MGNIKHAESEKEWTDELKNLFVARAKESIGKKKRFDVAISGGSTPNVFYERLVSETRLSRVDWEKINFYWVDERIVEKNNSNSNFGTAAKFLQTTPAILHPMLSGIGNINSDIELYVKSLMELPIVNNYPQFDLIYLGIGLDGHTASIFPNTSAVTNETDWVVKNHLPWLNQDRITITFPLILNAMELCILIRGKEKLKILLELIAEKTSYPFERILKNRVKKTWYYLD